jgi:hypothetical protein
VQERIFAVRVGGAIDRALIPSSGKVKILQVSIALQGEQPDFFGIDVQVPS